MNELAYRAAERRRVRDVFDRRERRRGVARRLVFHLQHERDRPPRRAFDPAQHSLDALLVRFDLPVDRFGFRLRAGDNAQGILRLP